MAACLLLPLLAATVNACNSSADCPALQACQAASCIALTSSSIASDCWSDSNCPRGSFCFIGQCLQNRTMVGESCKFGIQCSSIGAFCQDGFCSCLSFERFDGNSCVKTHDFLIYPLVLASASGLTFLIISTLLVVYVVKYRKIHRELAAARAAGPLPVKSPIPV